MPLADMLTRGEVHDPVIEGHLITVPEVRMTADLRLATIYVMPLGGHDKQDVLPRSSATSGSLRGEIARRVNLKFAPDIRFPLDERFDEAERIEKLLRTPAVRRDLDNNADDEIERDQRRRGAQRPKVKREKRDVHGWLVLDKPVGMTSTHAVSVVKRLFQAKRAGHAGTLDPLASGLLPIALGEATKTVPFVMEGRKVYHFTVRWGEERDTDDAEGRITTISSERPTAAAIRALLPRFTGPIEQVPPHFSAVKIAGERAYDLAREGETVELAPRPVEIHRLDWIATPDPDHAILAAECGKGTYVRALARDLGRLLGCFGHVAALRRTAVGPFTEDVAVEPRSAAALRGNRMQGSRQRKRQSCSDPPLESGLGRVAGAAGQPRRCRRLARGQAVLLRGRDAPVIEGLGIGFRAWIAGGAGRSREGGIAPAAHLQSRCPAMKRAEEAQPPTGSSGRPAGRFQSFAVAVLAEAKLNFRWLPPLFCDIAPVARLGRFPIH